MATITAEAVGEAAERLLEGGEEPTLRRVRDVLGGGSYATLTPLLGAWRAARQERQELAEVEMPDEVSRLLVEVGARVWRAARQVAEVGRAGLERDLADAKVAADKEAAEQADALAEVEARAGVAEGRAGEAERRLAELQAEVPRIRHESEVAAATAAAQVALLREQVGAVEARADREAGARRGAEAEVARLSERLRASEAEVARLSALVPQA